MQPPSTASRETWPPDYVAVWHWRQQQILNIRSKPELLLGALEYYRIRPVEFINHWVDTYDPRNAGKGTTAPPHMPFILFQRQSEMVQYLYALLEGEENGLIEKCRDMGATWLACAVSVHLWRFYGGAAVGWGSRKEALVDKIGDPDSIFEKMRMIIRRLPPEFLPSGFRMNDHMPFMKILNPDSGATITGEAGDNIGRGGRKLIYFKDESAHYERPEKIEAALADNTRVQIDISSVNGLGNVFHRRREAGVEWDGGEIAKGKTNVFVMDWRDHPAKTEAWYDARRQRAEEEGLLTIFAQEVDRNYAASVEGIIIKAEWVNAAIDAHIKLKLPEPTGKRIAGLDVADEGADRNALAQRKGYMLEACEDWPQGDTGQTTRKALGILQLKKPVEVQYDSIGVGAGVKAESNRLSASDRKEEQKIVEGLSFVPWSAAASVQFPDDHLLKDENGNPDEKSPTNQDFYKNLKAQGWWELRRRFEKTYKAVTEGEQYDPDELISISSNLPNLRKIQKELSQATASKTTASLKLVVDKAPEGTRSPNLADAIVMAYWPIIGSTFDWKGAI